MKFIFGNALWHWIMQSDMVSWLVLLTLLGMLLHAGQLFLYKLANESH